MPSALRGQHLDRAIRELHADLSLAQTVVLDEQSRSVGDRGCGVAISVSSYHLVVRPDRGCTLTGRLRRGHGAADSRHDDGSPRRSRCRFEEFLGHSHELVRVSPYQCVAAAIDDDQLRAPNAVVQHVRVMHRHRLIV